MSKSFKKRFEDDYDEAPDDDSWKRELRDKRKKKAVEQTSWMKPEDEEVKNG